MLQLQKSITFSEDEYKNLCMSKGLLNDLRKILFEVKGIDCAKSRLDVIENFIFNSVNRKNAHPKLLSIYKKLTQRWSYDEILSFIRSKRIVKHHVTCYYSTRVAEIILSELSSSEFENKIYAGDKKRDAQKKVNAEKYINIGRQIVALSRSKPYTGQLYNHDLDAYLMDDECMKCACCIHKTMSFANECIINIGSDIFKTEMYKFLLFSIKKKYLIPDLINLICLLYVDAL